MSAENTIRAGEPQEGDVSGSRNGWGWKIIIMAFILALPMRGVAAWYAGAAHPQEVRYITIARGIASGAGFVGLDRRFPDIIQPPLYPLMLAAAFLTLPGADLAAARGVSVVMGALLVFPVAILSRRLFGADAAWRAALLVAIYPLLTQIAGLALTEATFAVTITLAALCVWRGIKGKTRIAPWMLGTGLLLGLGFITRPEGLTYLGVSVLAAIVGLWVGKAGWRTIAAGAALPVAGFAALAVPYILWVHGETGQWLLAPKAVLVQVHHQLVQEGQREHWKEPYGSLLFFEHVKFGLDQDATEIRSHHAFDAVSVGLSSEGILVSDEGDVALSDPTMASRMIYRNLKELYLETIKYGYVIPSLLLMLGGVGLFSRPWAGEFRGGALLTLAFFMGSFSFLLTHVQSRFLYSAIPFAIPWIAEGWRRAEVWALASVAGGGTGRAARRTWVVRLAIGMAVVAMTLVHAMPPIVQMGRVDLELKEIGIWIRGEFGPGTRVMAVTPVAAYYAEAAYEVLPYAELDDVLAYARHKRIDFLVADRAEIPTFRPQLTRLLNPARPHPGLTLVRAQHERTSRAIYLYRVQAEFEAARE